MRQNILSVASAVASLSFLPITLAGNPVYQPCPLLKAYYHMPTIDKNAEAVKSFTKSFTGLFDQLVKAGGSEDFSEIAPNTTSFSVVLFSGSVRCLGWQENLQPVADTLNLRNGTGLIRHYASYFGLAPDFNAGFAILAHDTEATRGPDLNVYADIVSLAIVKLQELAATEATARYVGTFEGPGGVAAFNTSRDGPGLLVSTLTAGENDLRAQIANAAGIKLEDLDFRLYPSNVGSNTQHQFVAVFQDKSAPVDMGTPTCITWQDVDSLGSSVDVRVVFTIDASGKATNVTLKGGFLSLGRSA
ncbi:uncharacterized protein CLUP02_09318 [Colletotrichum lupini]|uniref:Beta-lactamase-like ARB-00930-like C-terminal domain-containing protein n=1 Tax=Colletotrichum lupini TaxID=145971 RepID=A0A9Q8SWC4_9PEZI|nr:uncharacterized protein CLUP02_09318 [Colletotrichum lupini]UQC83822.1 hypothetical protein CLUP02_09318 [Colletotrichum lupini]